MTKNMENANNAKQELLSWLRMMVCVVLGTVLLFTLVLIWIARRLDGIFEDQKHYLLRVHEQEQEERGGF